MSPGLPGTGIGGLFYLLSAIWMPFYEVGRVSMGRGRRSWRMVTTQFALATGILAGIWLTGWLIGAVVVMNVMGVTVGQLTNQAGAVGTVVNVVRMVAICGPLALLALVLLMVHLLRLVVGGPVDQPRADPVKG